MTTPPPPSGSVWSDGMNEHDQLREITKRHDTLVKGLRKAVKDDNTEWVDANIIRLLLDRNASAESS